MVEKQINLFAEIEEEEDALENEDDLGNLDTNDLSTAIVNSTDWTIETILSQVRKGNIVLNPEFQRRDAWARKRKSEFIESLFLNFPIPQIVLAADKKMKGKYIVIDGKQRLLSLSQFASSGQNDQFEQLKLTGLTVRRELNGKSLCSLREDPKFSEDIRAFENETVRTVVIKHWPNESFLYHVFLRLNTNSVGLSPQELRQALHPGKFIEFAASGSEKSAAIREILSLKKPDFRMRDVEIFIRYYAFKYFIHQYNGSMKDFLDMTCSDLNAAWETKYPYLEENAVALEEGHIVTKNIFKENFYRKWTGEKYERKFNRAIFDIMIFYFSQKDIAAKVSGKESELENEFKSLCITDREFLGSIERTTKSIESTCYRMGRWGEVLNKVLGLSLPKLRIENNRIV